MMPVRGCKCQQLAAHATQRLQHARIYALPLSQLEGNFLRNSVKTFASSRSTYPSNQSHQPVRIPRQRKIHPRLQHVFPACTHAARCQPIFPAVHHVTNFAQRCPQPVHRSHEAYRPQFFEVRNPSPFEMSDISPRVSGTSHVPVSSTKFSTSASFSNSCSGSACNSATLHPSAPGALVFSSSYTHFST